MSIDDSIDRVRMPSRVRRRGIVPAFAVLGLGACAANGVTGLSMDARNQTVVAVMDQEVDITFGNVGPAPLRA